jgi:hypothetical protein
MVLVMLGHLSGAGVEDSFFKWVLYGFHMPMFMALSGYLVPVERLRDDGLRATLGRYWWRMILPWVVLFVVAQPMVGDWRHGAGWVNGLVHPWNHLWFVPVLTAFIIAGVVVPVSRLWLFAGPWCWAGRCGLRPSCSALAGGRFPLMCAILPWRRFSLAACGCAGPICPSAGGWRRCSWPRSRSGA